MANNYEITLNIKAEEEEQTSAIAGIQDNSTITGGSESGSAESGNKKQQSQKEQQSALSSSLKTIKKAQKGLATVGATQIASTLLQGQLSTIALKTGRNEYQDRVQTTFGIVNEVSSLAMSTLTTTAINPVLGAITLASGLMVKAVQYGTQQNALQIAQDNENTEHSLMRKRMGGNGRRSSTN